MRRELRRNSKGTGSGQRERVIVNFCTSMWRRAGGAESNDKSRVYVRGDARRRDFVDTAVATTTGLGTSPGERRQRQRIWVQVHG